MATEGEVLFNMDKAQAATELLLEAFGVPLDEHTERTASRAAKAWQHMLGGYGEDPGLHLDTTFPVDGEPGLVMVAGIEVQSTCAHHLLPITGLATVAYRPAPEGRVVGLSKLARVVEGYARRLQVQEQLGRQVVDAIQEHLHPLGAACVITADHGCMTMRGIRQRSTTTTTVATTGLWTAAGGTDLEQVIAQHRAVA